MTCFPGRCAYRGTTSANTDSKRSETASPCHDPFVTVNEAIRTETDIHSTQQTVYTPATRKRVADTDVGKTLLERIEDLTRLLSAYRSGAIKEHSR